MGNAEKAAAIFAAAANPFAGSVIFKAAVVDLMALVDALEHFKRSDVPALRGGVQEIRFDPKDFHEAEAGATPATASVKRFRRPVRNVSPQIWRLRRFQSRSVPSCVP